MPQLPHRGYIPSLSQDDSDARAVRAQLVKARRVWARLGRVLRSEKAPPRICGMFYRGVVQAVLLFGSETWALGPALLARLEGFHIRAAYRMALRHRPQRDPVGVWTYPDSASVLNECGLQTVEVYIRRRRAAIVDWVATRPLHAACREGEPMRGSPRHLWWWEQEFALDEDEEADSPHSYDGDDSSVEP